MQFIDLDVDGDLDKICGDADNFPESGSGAAASLVPSLANTIDTAVGDFDNDLRTDLMALRGALRPNGAANVAANEVDIWFRDGTGTVATFKSSGNLRILVDGNGGGPYQEPDVIQHNSATNLSRACVASTSRSMRSRNCGGSRTTAAASTTYACAPTTR